MSKQPHRRSKAAPLPAASEPGGLGVTGCSDPIVGPIVRGNYEFLCDNHGRPVYKKDEQAEGLDGMLDVMLYYWDDKDSPSFCGWWFGPQVGGDQVWAFHPDNVMDVPPKSGWRVPFDGDVDPSMLLANIPAPAKRHTPAKRLTPTDDKPPAEASSEAKRRSASGSPQRAGQGGPEHGGSEASASPTPGSRLGKLDWSMAGAKLQERRRQQQEQQEAAKRQDQGRPEPRSQQVQPGRSGRSRSPRPDRQNPRQDLAIPCLPGRAAREKEREMERERSTWQPGSQAPETQLALCGAAVPSGSSPKVLWSPGEAGDRKKLGEGAQQKLEAEDVRKREQRAILAIRKVVQRVRVARPENFENVAAELSEILEREGEAAGSQQAKIHEEAAKVLTMTKKRIGFVSKYQEKEDLKKQEHERMRRQYEEATLGLVKQLEALVNAVEVSAKGLYEASEKFNGETLMSVEEIETHGEEIERVQLATKAGYKECMEFVRTNRASLEQAVERVKDTRKEVAAMLARADQAARQAEVCSQAAVRARAEAIKRAEVQKFALVKRAAAQRHLDEQAATFEKYDRDRDGRLSGREVLTYAEEEFGHKLPERALENILRVLVAPGQRGVDPAEFQRLRVSVGVSREYAREGRRREQAAELRRRAEEQREALRKDLASACELFDGVEERISSAESEIASRLAEERDGTANCTASELEAAVDAANAALSAAQADVAAARARSEEVDVSSAISSPSVSSEDQMAEDLLQQDKGRLVARAGGLDARLGRVAVQVAALGRRLVARRVAEVSDLQLRVVDLLRTLRDECGYTDETVFAEIDSKGDGVIDEEEWLAFLQKRWGEKGFPRDTVVRWIKRYRADTDPPQDTMPEDINNLLRVHYQVNKPTVMMNVLNVQGGKVVRRLEVGEIIEHLEGPSQDETTGVRRIRGRATRDGTEGWATVEGDAGTVFLEKGGFIFTVLKDLPLTDAFELGSSGAGDAVPGKDLVCALSAGDTLEVIEHERKDETSGLRRMKVRTRSDGAVGWATSYTGQGMVYLAAKTT